MYDLFIEWTPLLVLFILGTNVYPMQIENDEQQYYALSKTVLGFTMTFLLMLIFDSLIKPFF